MNSASEPTGAPIPILFMEECAETGGAVAEAMESARSAQTLWARSPVVRRLRLVRELRRLVSEHGLELARASSGPRSRPPLESLTAEVLPLAEACRFLEREAEEILRPRPLRRSGRPLWLGRMRSEIHRDPFGVVLIVGPGNYPLLLPGVQVIQALVAGNSVLVKPGAGGTAAARALRRLILRAGFDPHLVALLPESVQAARAAIHARPDKVLVTGSGTTGMAICKQLAPQLVPASLELSGSDALVVREDADLDLVVRALRFGLTLNNGATCMAPKRIFASLNVTAELERRIANAFPAGNTPPQAYGTHPGMRSPLPGDVAETVRSLLDDALARGAHCVAGGIGRNGAILAPLVLGGVSPDSRLMQEEAFAPIAAMVAVEDDREAVQRTNDSPFALAASIFSRDESAARSLAAEIRAGVVTINDLIIPTADPRLPFGGRRRSGFGVTRGAEGLLELTAPKVVTVSRDKFRPAFDAPRPGDEAVLQAYLQLAHGRGLGRRARAFAGLVRSLFNRTKQVPG
jgi:acyl-CoA reductase-like NAD-dependent aldehyde dehydrogenase